MKILVVIESTNAYIQNILIVLVVLRVIGKYKKILWVLRTLIIKYRSSFSSYLEHLVGAVGWYRANI